MNSDAKTVRGLSIAVVVLSSIFLVGAVAWFALVALFGVAANDPSAISAITYELNSTDGSVFDDDAIYYNDYMDEDTVGAALGILMALGGVFGGWLLIVSVASLVAGILGIRSYNRPEKMGGVFGWAIAGAVLAFLSGRIITMALLIITAVYANKVKRAMAAGGFAAPAYGQPQQPYGYAQQPYYGQPQGFDSLPQQGGYAQQPYGVQPMRPAEAERPASDEGASDAGAPADAAEAPERK